jgi:membrane peptidoglycan carboxypeptidase
VVAGQATLAVKLDLAYSRQQILQTYAAVVYFGHGSYGLAGASCGYFGVRPAALSWPQAALLAGLVRDPSALDPVRTQQPRGPCEQQPVLSRLTATGRLTQAQARAALAVPLPRLLAGAGACQGA